MDTTTDVTMGKAEKLALLDSSLTRAAELIGDITPPVMALYYARHPDARVSFERHGLGGTAQLEGEMVGNSLYCLMHCLESPMEVEILLDTSVPHHHFTLDVPLSWYQGLVDATIDVVIATVPPGNEAEQALWTEIRTVLGAVFDGCRAYLPTSDPLRSAEAPAAL